jgi:hypothetical protein
MIRSLVALGFLLLSLFPLQLAFSQARLDSSVESFSDGDCEAAIDSALGSLRAFGGRAEPYAILGYCDVRLGDSQLGVSMMGEAIERDPANWEYHYGLALVRAASGLDPRTETKIARSLNPKEQLAVAASRAFAESSPEDWRSVSRQLELPMD